ncbi:MAG: hypothetical protein U0X40_00270 [Ferruginibacter sp.]
MNLLKHLLNRFNGLHFNREYCCLSYETFSAFLFFYLVRDNRVGADITHAHSFAGYSPLIFVLRNQPLLTPGQDIRILISAEPLPENEIIRAKDALAELYLRPVKIQDTSSGQLLYYKGISGRHQFLSSFQQWVGGLYNNWFNRQPGNVFLNNHLYRQVQVAYALPRIISLITVEAGGLYNLFPTDLHGQPTGEHYVISLRTGGKALEQVKKAGRLLLSEMEAGCRSRVYQLGKNHMQPLKPPDNFFFSGAFSALFALPLPEGALAYRELELDSFFEEGIHTLLLFRIRNRQALSAQPQTLAHIHNAYASWRYKKGLAGNYLGG